jgi:hypothetical protein
VTGAPLPVTLIREGLSIQTAQAVDDQHEAKERHEHHSSIEDAVGLPLTASCTPMMAS